MRAQTSQNPAQPTELEQKHVPVITIGKPTQKEEKEVIVKVPHPMERDHQIRWLRLEQNQEKVGEVRFSSLDQEAKGVFSVKLAKGDQIRATDSCNLHGEWYNGLRGKNKERR